jgi:hypothetical protein
MQDHHLETEADHVHDPGPTVETVNASAGATGGGDSVGADPNSVDANSNAESTIEMLEQFPPEIATLLIMAGVAGVLLPGPVGAPLLIAGGVILWPKTFRPVERWFSRKFPGMHREGVIQLKDFIRDLNHRYPPKS